MQRHVHVVVRVLLGLLFAVFGLNGFLNLIPPPETSQAGAAFLGALANTGYMLPLIKGTELGVGVLLVSGRCVPLALVLLAPVTVNILLFHVVLDPAPALPLALIGAQVYLAYVHRAAYAGLFARSTVSGGEL